MSEVVFDTTVLIDHLRGYGPAEPVVKRVESGEISGRISALTITELFAGKNSANSGKREKILRLIGLFECVPVDEVVAEKAGAVRRDHGLHTTDSVVAATALLSGSKLFTSNVKDFEKVKGLEAKSPY